MVAVVRNLLCTLLVAAAGALALPAQAAAPLRVSPGFAQAFGSGMVLPHGTRLWLGGHAMPNTRLTLKIDGRTHQLRSDARGAWRQQIEPLAAGGPYTIELRDAQGATSRLDDVLAGELWLCSGQSNMEFSVSMSVDHPPQMLTGHPAIRLLQVAHQTALAARDTFSEAPRWQVADADAVRRFSALCYFFARQRIDEAGVPMGLVNASWGGSAIEAWISEQRLAKIPAQRRAVELLRQYRDDPRGSELAFAADWTAWWQSVSTMGNVWEQGVLDGHADWQPAPLADWSSYPDPRLAAFTGNLWFSASFELSEAQSRKGASFVLGRIDEVDTTWLNGRFVANSFGYGTRREYPLEPGMLRAGSNQFSVFVTNTYGAGGMTGPAADVGIRFDDGGFLPLGQAWKYRIVPREAGYPPRAPWESVAGVSGMFNGMLAPLRLLQPTGVIWYQGESNAENADAYGELLQALVEDWRAQFDRADLPFLIVQLPNYGRIATSPAESGWATLRHAQQQVALRDAHVGLVVTQDVGDDADIHPRRKYVVAERALQVARTLGRRDAAGQDGILPRVTSIDASSLQLGFFPPLELRGPEPSKVPDFQLCRRAPMRCVMAEATWQGSRIHVDRSALPAATHLRYCWSDGGTCALKSLSGWPVTSFELPLQQAR